MAEGDRAEDDPWRQEEGEETKGRSPLEKAGENNEEGDRRWTEEKEMGPEDRGLKWGKGKTEKAGEGIRRGEGRDGMKGKR